MIFCFFLSRRPPPRSTRTDILLPYTTLFRFDLVVLDEGSMDDIFLMRSTLRAIDPQRTRLLVVGDNDQLPSVGPGRVLGDMIDSGVIPTVRLTEIGRASCRERVCQYV